MSLLMAPLKNSSCINSTVQGNKTLFFFQWRSAVSMSIYVENSKHSVLVLLSIAGGTNPYLFFATIVKNWKKKRENYDHQMSHLSTIQCRGFCPLSDATASILMPFKRSAGKTAVVYFKKKIQSTPWLSPSKPHLNHIHQGPTWASKFWKEPVTLFVTRRRVRKSLCQG